MQKLFLTFEGLDFSGKSTQSKKLLNRLEKMALPAVLVREPGGTHISESIREIVLDNKHVNMDARTELLLYTAARAQIVTEKIIPVLEDARIVICDRYVDSTVAYQGYGRKLDLDVVRTINDFATRSLKPDCTIYLDIFPETAEKRRQYYGLQKDRLEGEALAFYRTVREGYLQIAKNEPNRIFCIDGKVSIEAVEQSVWKVVEKFLEI